MIKASAAKGNSAYAISKEISVSENTVRNYKNEPAAARPEGHKEKLQAGSIQAAAP